MRKKAFLISFLKFGFSVSTMFEQGSQSHGLTVSENRFLVSNVAPVIFPNANLPVAFLPFRGKEGLARLRKDHGSTNLFHRVKDEVICASLDGSSPKIGEAETIITLHQNLVLSAALVRNSLIDFYLTRKCEILGFRPVEIVSTVASQNVLIASLPKSERVPDWLSVRSLCQLDLRVVSANQKPFLALVVNIRMRKRIQANCLQLRAAGVDITGLLATRTSDPSDPRIAPLKHTIGVIRGFDADEILLDEGEEDRFPAQLCSLRVDNEAFGRVMRSLYASKADRYLLAIEAKISDAQQAESRLERIQAILGDLQSKQITILGNVSIKFDKFLSQEDDRFPTVEEMESPLYVFDPAGRKTDKSKPRGLDQFGPYTAQTFTPTNPNICVVCEASKKGDVERFLKKFLDGTDTAGLRFPPFVKGLCRGYHLKGAKTEFFLAQSPTAAGYLRAAETALEARNENSRWDIALIQMGSGTRDFAKDQNPYLVTKAAFHSQQIPVQEFEDATMAMQAGNLEYALSNMALATYAKLGGIPWLIKADPTIAHEFVVGLGSASIGEGILGQKERVVGITTLFSGDGNYFLSNLTRAVPISEFKSALLDALRTSFDQARSRMGWQKGDHVRLVFHSFKPMKDAEAEAVVALAAELSDFSVDFAFIHVIDDHPCLLFDIRQRGEKDYRTGRMKGASVPLRGLVQRLSKHEALVTLAGPKELKKVDDGMPYPALLRLHPSSSFKDLDYLSRQVFHFSAHSWRSFLPASMPVTIVYSQLIARLLGNLSKLPRWSPDFIRGRLGRSRWFL